MLVGHASCGARRAGARKAAGKTVARGAREARSRGQHFSPPPSALLRGARRVPRGVHEHGHLPMGAAPRIASMNFAIAYTLIYYPIKVMDGGCYPCREGSSFSDFDPEDGPEAPLHGPKRLPELHMFHLLW